MTKDDRKKWDARYRETLGGMEPSPILQDYWNFAPLGRALDIACGNGRNSLFLAEKGFVVDAVDISTVVINHLAGKNRNINPICADLDTWSLPKSRYDLIVNIRFLDRGLFPLIKEGLKPGGVLIFESFMDGKQNRFCLYPNELLQAFVSLRVVYYEEKKADYSEKFDYSASMVAIKHTSIDQ
jgi:SAM-dependent methyltransferase